VPLLASRPAFTSGSPKRELTSGTNLTELAKEIGPAIARRSVDDFAHCGIEDVKTNIDFVLSDRQRRRDPHDASFDG